MPELFDGLRAYADEKARQPAFEEIVGRAGRVRRRRMIGTFAGVFALVLAVAATGFAVTGQRRPAGPPRQAAADRVDRSGRHGRRAPGC